jgi:hypothetical protein
MYQFYQYSLMIFSVDMVLLAFWREIAPRKPQGHTREPFD